MSCKHLRSNGSCDIKGYLVTSGTIYTKCDYLDFGDDKSQKDCYYYEAPLEEIMNRPVYDIKTNEL